MQVVAVHFVRGGIGAGAMSERIKGVLPLATSIPVLAFLWIEFSLHFTFANLGPSRRARPSEAQARLDLPVLDDAGRDEPAVEVERLRPAGARMPADEQCLVAVRAQLLDK